MVCQQEAWILPYILMPNSTCLEQNYYIEMHAKSQNICITFMPNTFATLGRENMENSSTQV